MAEFDRHWMAKSDFTNMEGWALCGRKVPLSDLSNQPFRSERNNQVTCPTCLGFISAAATHLRSIRDAFHAAV